jgi:hypothetical protein
MNWQQYFEDHILDRGYEYYLNGEVQNITKSTIAGKNPGKE